MSRRGGVLAVSARRHVMLLLGIAITAVVISCGAPAGQPTPGALPPTGGRDAVGPQYDSTHVYVTPATMDRFVASWLATFGGTSTTPSLVDVTPTPSQTKSQLVLSPVGTLSVFEFQTPIPYPFGAERTGLLLRNFDHGVQAAQASDAHLLVAPFRDPIGRDAIVQFPGGIDTQLYWHTTPPSYPALATVPENRIYLPPDAVDAFLRSYLAFSGGTVTSDDRATDAAEIGLPGQRYRRIRISAPYGNTSIAVTDGHLPYPFGRELTGYAVADLTTTMAKATAAGATTLFGPFTGADRTSAVMIFPGGYIAELHQSR